MRLLVLGGTRFVGRAVVSDALARGWAVTVFNRGRTGDPPAGVEALRGDRTRADDLGVLTGREWDLVVDTWDSAPRVVRDSARLLADTAGHYVYVSSRSVYRPPLSAGMSEDAPLEPAAPDAVEGPYGVLKAGGELAVREAFGDRALLVRAGLILGPHEDAGRLPWWLWRMTRGGTVLAPGPPNLALQYIDVRDLASWLLDAAERRLAGPYNAVSRPGHTTMAALLAACRQVTGRAATLRWVDPAAILAAGVQPWNDLPIWVPPGHPFRPMHETDADKAHAAGLECRPVEATVADTWGWLRTTLGSRSTAPARRSAPARRPKVGLDPAVETAILSRAGGAPA